MKPARGYEMHLAPQNVYRVPGGAAKPNFFSASGLARRADAKAVSNRPLYWAALMLEM